MATVQKPYFTEAEYLARERKAEHKSEYYRGEIFAMAGATEEHNLIVANVVGELRQQLKNKDCRVYPSDLRTRMPTGLFTYPDAIVVCGESRFLDNQFDTLLNPKVVIEVLSESTEAYDRGKKFEHYRSIESLTHFVLIASDRPHVEVYTRQASRQWLLAAEENSLGASVDLPSIDCRLALAEVYDKVAFEQNVGSSGALPPPAK